MYIYVVMFDDSLDAVYSENMFKDIYKEFLNKDGKFWKSLVDIAKVRLDSRNDFHWIFPEDMK